MAGSIHSAVRMTVLSLFLFGSLLHASTVLLTVDSVNPDPVLIDQPAAVQVSAAFTADGTEQAQLTNQWSVEYRYHWSLSPDGAVSGLSPELADGGWTVWSTSPVCSGSCTFPTTGIKSLLVMCQVRLRKGEEIGDVCAEGSVTTPISCTVDLADAVNFRAVEVGTDWVRLSWDPSPDADVVGYAYHIEPDETTTVDVGNVTETVVSDLEPGVEYEFGLHAYDAEGNMTHTVFACATTEPEPPSNVTAYGEDGSAVIIFKRSPTSTVTDYKLEQSPDSGVSWSSCSTKTIPAWYPDEPYDYVEISVPGLTNGTTYRFRVSALPPGSPSPTGENPESGDIIPSPFFDLYLTKAKVNRWRACMKYDDCQPIDWSARPRSVAEVEELHTALEGMSGKGLIPRESYSDCPVTTVVVTADGYKGETVDYNTGSWLGAAIPGELPNGCWLTLPADSNRGLITSAMVAEPDTALGLLTYWRGATSEELVAAVVYNRLEELYEYYYTGDLIYSVPNTYYGSGMACDISIYAYRSYYLFEWGVDGESEYTWQERYLTVEWNALPTDVADAFSLQTGSILPGTTQSYTILPRGGVGGTDDDPSTWATGPIPDGPLLAGGYVGEEIRPGENDFYKLMEEHTATVTDIQFTDGSGNALSNGDHGYAIIAVPNDTATIQAWATYTVVTTPPCEFTVPLAVEISFGDELAHLSKPDQFHAARPGVVTLSATACDIPAVSQADDGPLPAWASPTTETINVAIPNVKIIKPNGDAADTDNDDDVSWKGAPNHRWDFQGLSDYSLSSHAIEIEGLIQPTGVFTYQWDLDEMAAGTLTGDTSTPTYTRPTDVTASPCIFSWLELTPVKGETRLSAHAVTKQVAVYKDHLARDYHNFGTGSCDGEEEWTTPFGSVTTGSDWNCHGSCIHATWGTATHHDWRPIPEGGDGDPDYTNWPTGTHDVVTIDWSTLSVSRGDIVTFWDAEGGPIHSSISLGSKDNMWGANNTVTGSGTWGSASVKDYAQAHADIIKVHRRPVLP